MNDWTFPKAEKGHGRFWTQNTHHKMKKKPQKQSWTTNKTPKTIQFLEKTTNIPPENVVLFQTSSLLFYPKKKGRNQRFKRCFGVTGLWLTTFGFSDLDEAVAVIISPWLGWIIHRIYGWWFRNPLGNQLRLVKYPHYLQGSHRCEVVSISEPSTVCMVVYLPTIFCWF